MFIASILLYIVLTKLFTYIIISFLHEYSIPYENKEVTIFLLRESKLSYFLEEITAECLLVMREIIKRVLTI